MQKLVALLLGQFLPSHVGGNAFALCEFCQRATLVLVARHAPRIDRAIAQGSIGVGHDEGLIVLEGRAEAVAPTARATRTVERKELRRRRRRSRSVVRALEALREAPPHGGLAEAWGANGLGEENDAIPITLSKCRRDGVDEAAARVIGDSEAIDNDEELLREGHVDWESR